MSGAEPAISISGLNKCYRLYSRPLDWLREVLSPTRRRYHSEFWALRDLSFDVPRGATYGLIGHNGAGKSTTLKLIAGKLRPTSGKIEVRGKISSILELGTGFQEVLTGRQNAKINALFVGHDPWDVDRKLEEIVEFAGLREHADQPLRTYSSGMRARLAFAVLAALEPEILFLDEALATGDAGFAEKCKGFLRSLRHSGCTIVVAGHDIPFLVETCDQLIWLDQGRMRGMGQPAEIAAAYLHHIGHHEVALDRPRNVLIRIDPSPAAPEQEYEFHCLELATAGGEVLGSHHLGWEDSFADLVGPATELGFTAAAARSAWGEAMRHPANGSGYRVVRPAAGPGGSAYLAIPFPRSRSLPDELRLAGNNCLAHDLELSLFFQGRFWPLGGFGAGGPRDGSAWYRNVFDLRPILAATAPVDGTAQATPVGV